MKCVFLNFKHVIVCPCKIDIFLIGHYERAIVALFDNEIQFVPLTVLTFPFVQFKIFFTIWLYPARSLFPTINVEFSSASFLLSFSFFILNWDWLNWWFYANMLHSIFKHSKLKQFLFCIFWILVVHWILNFTFFYANGNVLEIEQWFEGRLLCVEFWPLQWQRRRLQTLKRNFKLILSRSQPKLYHSILLEANNFPDFYLELQTHSKQVHHIFQFCCQDFSNV